MIFVLVTSIVLSLLMGYYGMIVILDTFLVIVYTFFLFVLFCYEIDCVAIYFH